MLAIETGTGNSQMTKVEAFLLNRESPNYAAYYNGKMSYKLAGQDWEEYVTAAFPSLKGQNTSENIFKTVVDLYAENLVPVFPELQGISNILMPLLTRGEALALINPDGTVHFPEHFEIMSDGDYTIACIFTRSLKTMTDNVVFAYSDGITRLFQKPIPDDFSNAKDRTGYQFVEEISGNELYRLALDDKGFGATLAALQDRVNHSILDQTVVAEMYARPFWYLLNVELPPKNPYLPAHQQPEGDDLTEQKEVGSAGRVFTTSAAGPFGQLTPPTINDMIAYHDSIIDKVPLTTGIPAHYFKPGTGTPPTGVALKVLSKRFNNRIARIREDIYDTLAAMATSMGIKKNAQADPATGDDVNEKDYDFWPGNDDLLQEALDQHGINLSSIGYPLKYIASVVTPGIDLEDYEEEEEGGQPGSGPGGEPLDMTAMGQPGLVATPGQVANYERNPGQKAKV